MFEQFDRIVFNSPTDEEGSECKDLLECGEPLLARFFDEVGDHLTPSGFLQMNLAMKDYIDSRFVDRLQDWITASGHELRCMTMICKRKRRHDVVWKRGWATFCHGRRSSWAEVDWPYKLLNPATGAEDLSDFMLTFLNNYEVLKAGEEVRLGWSKGLCCVLSGRRMLGLWDVPLAEIPENVTMSLAVKQPEYVPVGVNGMARQYPIDKVFIRQEHAEDDGNPIRVRVVYPSYGLDGDITFQTMKRLLEHGIKGQSRRAYR